MDRQTYYERQRDTSVVSDHLTATKVLVGINVVAFFLCEIIGDTEDSTFMVKAGAMVTPDMLVNAEYWRLVTAMFLHFGIQHLINNMLLLVCFGETLERRLGWLKFTVLYLIAGLAGNVMSLYLYTARNEACVSAGASGAVFGVFGGLIAITLLNHGRYEYITFKRLGIMTILALYVGFQSSGVNNIAHLTGVAVGFVLGFAMELLVKAKWERRK